MNVLHSDSHQTQHQVELILYSTLGCHLCELAEAELAKLQLPSNRMLPVNWIDISESDELINTYGEHIPVLALLVNGRILKDQALYWPFEVKDIAQWLNSAVM